MTLSGPAHLSWRERDTTINRIEGAAAFDGLGLTLRDVEVELPAGHLEVDGKIAPLLAEPLLRMTYRGQLDLDQISGWIDPGTAVSGEIEGPAATPTISLVLAGDELA